jgi:cytochrome c oxidase cbb3-type subunit 3/ubiquinol-cytochrome c reductase cytochrome c subunit
VNRAHERQERSGRLAGLRRLWPLLVLLAAGCDPPGKPKEDERPVPADQVTRFDTLFGENCAGCHGKDGLSGPAPLLNDPIFRTIIPEEDLKNVITHGRPGTPMPAFGVPAQGQRDGDPVQIKGTLAAAQIQVLVYEIKGIPYQVHTESNGDAVQIKVEKLSQERLKRISDGGGSSEEPGERMPKWRVPRLEQNQPPPPPYRPEGPRGDLKRGEAVFLRACAGCHGDKGQGGPAPEFLTSHQGRDVGAINDPNFLALISEQALRRLIITGRTDLGMPPYYVGSARTPRHLTDQDVNDLMALLHSWKPPAPSDGKK